MANHVRKTDVAHILEQEIIISQNYRDCYDKQTFGWQYFNGRVEAAKETLIEINKLQ